MAPGKIPILKDSVFQPVQIKELIEDRRNRITHH
jgi:hypothetical protein